MDLHDLLLDLAQASAMTKEPQTNKNRLGVEIDCTDRQTSGRAQKRLKSSIIRSN
jgi:hypothetical protein